MATDLAELLGAGLGLELLTGLPLFPATLIAAAGTVLLLARPELTLLLIKEL